MRRVVTGHDPDGKSVFVRDDACPHGAAMDGVPRFRIDTVWSSETTPSLPAGGDDPTSGHAPFFPAPGGSRFCLVTFPPQADIEKAAAAGIDLAEAERAFYARFPGLGEQMDPAEPGMHTSRTVDYGIVLRGSVELELDDGASVLLGPGDCVVQNGTRHAWRNPGDRECVMAFVILGATG